MPSRTTDSERFAELLSLADEHEETAVQSLKSAVVLARERMKGAQRDRSLWRTNWIRSALMLATRLERHESTREALEVLQPVMHELDACDDADLVMRTKQDLGRYLMIRGDLDLAMDLLQQALRDAEALNNVAVASSASGNIGMVFFNHREFDHALQWFNRTVALMRERGDKARTALALRSVGMTHSKMKHYAKALKSYTAALKELNSSTEEDIDVRIAIQIRESIGVDHLNLADSSGKAKHYQAAIRAFQECLELAKINGLDVSRAVALRNLGQVYAETGYAEHDIHRAISLFEEARQIVEPKSIHTLHYQINRELASAYEAVGDHVQALEAYKRYYASERAVIDLDSASKLRAIEERHRFERSQAELRREQERSLELEAEARQRTAELTSLTLAVGETNARLRDLSGRIRAHARIADQPTKQLFLMIIKDIDASLGTEIFWSGIEEQLSNLHGESLQYLSKHFPSLTPTERKVCALIRIDLSSKEIARLLNTEPRSIEKYRQRIRKKLGLTASDSLSTFISSL
jgi:tetratricopeptide (TPR) repeat protein